MSPYPSRAALLVLLSLSATAAACSSEEVVFDDFWDDMGDEDRERRPSPPLTDPPDRATPLAPSPTACAGVALRPARGSFTGSLAPLGRSDAPVDVVVTERVVPRADGEPYGYLFALAFESQPDSCGLAKLGRHAAWQQGTVLTFTQGGDAPLAQPFASGRFRGSVSYESSGCGDDGRVAAASSTNDAHYAEVEITAYVGAFAEGTWEIRETGTDVIVASGAFRAPLCDAPDPAPAPVCCR